MKALKAKLISIVQYFFTRGKTRQLSVSKLLAWLTVLCASTVGFKDILLTNGVVLTPKEIMIFKAAGIISGALAMIKIRNGQGQPSVPTPPAS